MARIYYVRKLDGRKQKYDESKLRRSLKDAGADKETIDKIIKKVKKIIYNGIETKKLFNFVFKEFKKLKPHTSSRYDLKNAILRLGITGFPFEKFVSEIFIKKGYSVKLNQFVKGKYIKHEIDISAKKGREKIMVECKHHAKPWLGCDIQTALYVYARFLDVKKSFTSPMLVTNTKFSRQVINYSNGVNLRLMGWKYPKGNSLEHNITIHKCYPITMLSSLNKNDVNRLLNLNVIFIRDIFQKNTTWISRMLDAPKAKADKILHESEALLSHKS